MLRSSRNWWPALLFVLIIPRTNQGTVGPSAYRFRFGMTLIIYGIAKKLVIADNVAVHANEVFVEGEHLANIGLIWWATLCFGIQIYCDFQRTPTSPLALHTSSVWNFLRISKPPMPPRRPKTFGAAGTFRSPLGCAITSTFHWEVRGTVEIV